MVVEAKVLVTQSYLTFCDPMDCSPPGSSVHGVINLRILERVPIPFSRVSSQPGIEPRSPALQADSSLSHQGSPVEAKVLHKLYEFINKYIDYSTKVSIFHCKTFFKKYVYIGICICIKPSK